MYCTFATRQTASVTENRDTKGVGCQLPFFFLQEPVIDEAGDGYTSRQLLPIVLSYANQILVAVPPFW